MGLKIYTGRSGTGKTHQMMQEIIQTIKSNAHQNIILFVPEQMSFQAEKEIARHVKGKTYTNFQVLSFKRLAYRLFLEVGGANKTFVSDVAINMMISKILIEQRENLSIYNKLTNNQSFISMIYDTIKEFKSYQINPDMILSMIQNENCNETLRKKLKDIHIIYNQLIEMYSNTLIDNEDFYQELSDKILDSEYIKNSIVYVDGYHSFTTIELNVIYHLIKTAKEVTYLSTVDNVFEVDMLKDDHLFNLPYRTLLKILNYANEENIQVSIEHFNESKRFLSDDLQFLEANYQDEQATYNESPLGIEVQECESPTAEVHAVARQIYQDVYIEGNQFNDYVIYTNNKELYYPLIQNIFKLYDIPVFIDDKKKMLDHSLLNFIDAVLEIIKSNFSYEAMFRAIKTEMFMPLVMNESKVTEKNYQYYVNMYRNRIDILENFCLAHGIKGHDWFKSYWEYDFAKKIRDLKSSSKKYGDQIEKIINETKDEITKPLFKFYEAFKDSKSVEQQIRAIYDLLIDLEVDLKVELYERVDVLNSHSSFELNESKKHKQVFNHIIDLFDELVEICGEYKLNTDEFIKIMRSGFANMKFAIVPPVLDQVMVGTIKRSRFEMMGHFDDSKTMGVKRAFVLGVNENEMPKVYKDQGLITNNERAFLIEHDFDMMPTVEKSFLDEYFVIYTVLTSPKEKLYLSYTLANSEKKEAFRSEIIETILKMYPKLKVNTIYDIPDSLDESLNRLYITSKTMTTSVLLHAMNLKRKGYRVHELWEAILSYYQKTAGLKEKLAGLNHLNEPTPLDEDDVKKLYSENITASVSAIERFNSCPYAFFMERGLKLSERDEQTMEAVDIGDLYHETLKDLALFLIKENKALHEIDLSQIPMIVNDIVENYAKIQRKYFLANKRNAYLLKKIKETLINSINVMHYQSKHSQFKILTVEEMFGYDADKFHVDEKMLPNGFKMRLKGFIDRVDVANLKDEPYIRIIDYKSGPKDIDFTKLYYGLSLQLLTYLDVVLNNSRKILNKEAKASGVLYYQVFKPEVKVEKTLNEEEIQNKLYDAFKMNGYTLKDEAVSQLFDQKLKDEKASDIVKVTLTKNGYHKSHSRVLDEETFDLLRKYTNKKIYDSVVDLTQGKVDIKPVRYNNHATCKYCKYHSICKFDNKLKENQYLEIEKYGDRDEVIQSIKEEIGGGKDE